MVAGVHRIDGDEGDVAQVLAAGERRLGRRCSFGLGRLGKADRDAVGVNGQHGGRARIVLAAQNFEELGLFGSVTAALLLRGGRYQNEVAIPQLGGRRRQKPGNTRFAVHRLDAHLPAMTADNAKGLGRPAADALDQLGFETAVLAPLEADQQAVAQARRAGLGLIASGRQANRGKIISALGQPHIEIAVDVAVDHVGHAHRRQGAGLGKPAPAAFAQRAFVLEGLQHVAQGPAVLALEAEGLGDV